MAWIFVDKEEEGGGQQQMRSQMRRNMRSGGYHSDMRDGSSYRDGYRQGYKHGWEDKEDEWGHEDMEYRRLRDSRGRYI